jgi:transposase
MSTLDHTFEPEAPLRRVEVITGIGRRRRFSADDKARIVEETLAPGAVVSEVARRHGLMPQQVFTWRRLARQPVASEPGPPEPAMFVPAVIGASSPPSERRHRRSRRTRKAAKVIESTGLIELEIDGVAVRVGRGADVRTVVAVIRALKAAR